MESRKIVLLSGALVAAGVTAYAARTLIAGSGTPQAGAVAAPVVVSGPEVLVATRALPVGTILDPTALKYMPWPKEQVDGAYYLKATTDLKKLQGTVVRNPITAGQPVTQGALVKPGDRGFLAAALGPGMRAVTFPVSAQSAVAGFVFPGDRIDLVLTQSVSGGGDGAPLKVSETVMRNVRVLATDQRTDNTTDDNGKMVVKTFGTVTVEATPKLAEQLAVAQTLGSISLSLRSLSDNPSEYAQAIASGKGKPSDPANPTAGNTVQTRFAGQPQVGNASFATGADVSHFARRSVPAKPCVGVVPMASGAGNTMGAPSSVAVAQADCGGDTGPSVRVARGGAVTVVPVGGKN